MRVRCPSVLALIAAVASSAGAQTTGPQSNGQGRLVPIANRTFIGINPLGVPFDILSAEMETGVAQGVTLGGSASHIDVNNERYSSLDFKFRYYPGEVVLRGFSLGATLGFLRYSAAPDSGTRQTLDSPTLGVIADYNWMLGLQRRFVVGTGIGAKRILAGTADRERAGIDRARLTVRFSVGMAF